MSGEFGDYTPPAWPSFDVDTFSDALTAYLIAHPLAQLIVFLVLLAIVLRVAWGARRYESHRPQWIPMIPEPPAQPRTHDHAGTVVSLEQRRRQRGGR